MHVVRVKQVNLYDIRAKQASRYNVVFSLHGDHAVCRLRTMQSADCILSPMQSADCAGSQIACNIDIRIRNMRRQMNDNFILLSVPQTLFVDLCSDYEANAPCYVGWGGVGRFYTACTAPALPRDTFCRARDVASARDLIFLHGAQLEENKFEMEVSCSSTKLRRVSQCI